MGAVTWPLFTNVVVRAPPFQYTVALLAKLDPFTIRVKPVPPAVATLGFRLVRVGAVAPGLIVNVSAFEVPPVPVFCTDTLAVPWLAIRFIGTVAAIEVPLPGVVVVRALPFQRTVAPFAM